MDRASIREFINRQRYGVVSSLAEDGRPQSALVGLACASELDIVFDTLDSARKYRNLLNRRVCSLVVGCCGEQTVQLEGHAEALEGEQLSRLQEIYFTHWPDGQERAKWTGIAYFVIHPCWLRYSDYQHSIPFIQEIAQEAILQGF